MNMIPNFEAVMQPRPRFGMGACTPALSLTATRAITLAHGKLIDGKLIDGKLIDGAADVAGPFRAPAFTGHATGQQLIGTELGYTTLIVATGDGELGSHPAREPV
jgi:hypothetical protein